MLAEIITIGDELLIGQTIDTNSAWIGEQLSLLGINIHQISSITDDETHIISALEEAAKRVHIIIITGGLGPTKDDLTKKALCKYFDTELILNPNILEKLEHLYKSYNTPFTRINQEQAWLPESCTILPNSRGTASGMWFEKNKILYISLPGVPYEMRGILTEEGFPRLKNRFNLPKIIHKTIRTIGAPESKLALKLELWENSLQQHSLTLAYLPSPGSVRLRLSGKFTKNSDLDKIIDKKIDELPALIGEYIYGYDKSSIETEVGKLLTQKGKTLSTAESCTGGSISRLITRIPGSSAYFKGGIVSYANEVKINILHVCANHLEKHGAVSQQVVEQMALNVRKVLNSDFSVATSGIAGPSGGSEEKPVGTVWIAAASKDTVKSKKLTLPYNNREQNIAVSADYTLAFLRSEFLLDDTA